MWLMYINSNNAQKNVNKKKKKTKKRIHRFSLHEELTIFRAQCLQRASNSRVHNTTRKCSFNRYKPYG